MQHLIGRATQHKALLDRGRILSSFRFNRGQKIVVFAIIVGFIERFRSQYYADGIGRKVVYLSPDQWWYVQTIVRPVKLITPLFRTVVEYNVKTAGGCNNKLLTSLQCMTRTEGATRHVVE